MVRNWCVDHEILNTICMHTCLSFKLRNGTELILFELSELWLTPIEIS